MFFFVSCTIASQPVIPLESNIQVILRLSIPRTQESAKARISARYGPVRDIRHERGDLSSTNASLSGRALHSCVEGLRMKLGNAMKHERLLSEKPRCWKSASGDATHSYRSFRVRQMPCGFIYMHHRPTAMCSISFPSRQANWHLAYSEHPSSLCSTKLCLVHIV